MKQNQGCKALGMIPINLNDLKAMRQAGKRFVRARWIPLELGGKIWYQLLLTMEGVEEPLQMVSARNRPRLWTTLPKMVDFLKVHFPEIKEATLELPEDDRS